MGRAKPDVRPPVAAIPGAKSIYDVEIPLVAMAVGVQRSGDWLAARRCDQCDTLPASHRCAVGVLPLLREELDYLIDFALGIAAPGGLTSGFALPI